MFTMLSKYKTSGDPFIILMKCSGENIQTLYINIYTIYTNIPVDKNTWTFNSPYTYHKIIIISSCLQILH